MRRKKMFYPLTGNALIKLLILLLIFSSFSLSANSKKDPISINFQDIPIRSLLQVLADHKKLNLVVSDSVQGNLTLRLDKVSWEKALETILETKGLAKRQSGNILIIGPLAEMHEHARIAVEKTNQTQQILPLKSEVIKINYANAEALLEMLYSKSNKGLSLLSERGSATVDKRTNSLIIKETKENIKIIKTLISQLDVPVQQVEIEARIVSIDKGMLDDIGVRWGIDKTSRNYQIATSIKSASSMPSLEGSQIDDHLNVNLAASGQNASKIAFQIASLGRDFLLDLELSALQTESKAEIISSPRLLTTNKRSAYIEQGTELPYLESASSGAAAVSFKKAVLSLAVTPQITHDNKLVLDLDVTQDRPAATVQSGTGEAVSINTQRINTQVLIENGETVMLGGIYQDVKQNFVEQVPLLGDIPFIGRFFRRNYETLIKRELLIFVTPRIVVQ